MTTASRVQRPEHKSTESGKLNEKLAFSAAANQRRPVVSLPRKEGIKKQGATVKSIASRDNKERSPHNNARIPGQAVRQTCR